MPTSPTGQTSRSNESGPLSRALQSAQAPALAVVLDDQSAKMIERARVYRCRQKRPTESGSAGRRARSVAR